MSWLTQLLGRDGVNTLAVDSTGTASVKLTSGGLTAPEVMMSHADFTLDSFERIRVSEPRIGFEYHYANGLNPAQWEATAYGAGTVAQNLSAFTLELNTTTASGTGYWTQAYAPAIYAPGIGMCHRHTFSFNQLITSVTQRVGIFSDQGTFPSTAGDGVYFEAAGSTLAIVRRTLTGGGAGAEERILQSGWNLDKMDGTGSSGFNLNPAMFNHLVIQYQWLGVGVVRVGFDTGTGAGGNSSNQGVIWAHAFNSPNQFSVPWCRTGSLPTRAEIFTTGTATSAGKLSLCNTCTLIEGDVFTSRGWRNFSGNSGATAKTIGLTSMTYYPVTGIRALLTNDITKRVQFHPISLNLAVTVAATTSTGLMWVLMAAPTPMTGATFAGTASTSSFVGVDQAVTATTAVTGTVIASGMIPNVVGTYTIDLNYIKDNAIRAGQNAAGSLTITGMNVLAVAIAPIGTSGAGAAIIASIGWREIV